MLLKAGLRVVKRLFDFSKGGYSIEILNLLESVWRGSYPLLMPS